MHRGQQRTNADGELGWRLRVWDARARRQREVTFYGTYREALEEMGRQETLASSSVSPQLPDAHLVTVADWAVEWLGRYAYTVRPAGGQPGVKRPKRTWRNARDVVSAYVGPALGENTRLRMLTHDYIYDAVAGLRLASGEPASPATKQKTASVIKRMLREAVLAGVLASNPAADLPAVWGKAPPKDLVPSLPQVETLADALEEEWPHHGDLVRFLAFTGLRFSEARNLRWEDLDFEARTLLVRSSKTTAGVRYALMLDQVLEPLERMRAYAEERNSPFVMAAERGGRLSYQLWLRHLNPVRAECGVNYTAHSLRHLCASLLIAAGADIETVREQMGHETQAVTQRVYRHAWQMNRSNLARSLSRKITGLTVEPSVEPAAQEAS